MLCNIEDYKIYSSYHKTTELSCYRNLHLKETAVEHSTLYFTTAVVFYIVTCF